jgi:hypothetical protein
MADNTFLLLKEIFPNNIILKEHYVNYKGVKLFFDFFIKDLGVLIECNGRQHFEFVKHFHFDKQGLTAQRIRDNLKKEYVQGSKRLSLVSIDYNEGLTKSLIIKKIDKALEG